MVFNSIRVKQKGKRKADHSCESEEVEEVDVGDFETPTTSGRTQAGPSSIRRSTRRARNITDAASPPPSPKHSQNTASPAQRRMVVRLRLPPQGKGKEKEESSDDEPPKNIFDDILGVEERDTGRTAISSADKTRFEKSRQIAEVCEIS